MNKKIILISIFFAFLIALIPLRANWFFDKSSKGGLVTINLSLINYRQNYSNAAFTWWEYRCSGSWRQRRYCRPSCGSWSNYQYCGSTSYGSWSYYCSGSNLYKKRTVYYRGCSGSSCYYYTSTQTSYVQGCGSTSYGSWSYYCSGSNLYRKRTVYYRGCSGSSCYSYTSTQTEYVTNCGSTSYGSWSYYCSGDYLRRQRTVYYRGCSGSSCYSLTGTNSEPVTNCGSRTCTSATYYCSGDQLRYKYTCSGGCSGTSCQATKNYDYLSKDCGSRTCTPYTYYCVGDKVYKKTTCSGGCSGDDCRESNTYYYFVEDCDIGCSGGKCIEAGGCLFDSNCPECYYCSVIKCYPTPGTDSSICGRTLSGNCKQQRGTYKGCVDALGTKPGTRPCTCEVGCALMSGQAECVHSCHYKDACPTGEWKTNWLCSGNWRYRIYGDMGCSGGECYSWSEKEWEYCGSDNYGPWSYYCSGNEVHRSRIIYYRGCSGDSCYSDWDIEIDYDVAYCGTSGYEYRISGGWQQRRYVEKGCKDGSCYTKYGPWENYSQDCGHTCLSHGTDSVAWPDCSCTNQSPASGYERIGTWNSYDCPSCTGYRGTGLQDCGHTCVSHGTASYVWPDCSCTNRSPASGYERIGTWNSSDCPNCTGYKKSGCSCTAWANGSCGGGSCSATQRQQTRTCTPSGCDSQSRCVDDSTCVSSPILNLTANPSSIIQGQFSTLQWSSVNTTSCSWTGGSSGSAATSGSKAVSPSATTTYSMSCTGSGGSISRSATVTVSIPIPNQSPSATNLKVAQPDYCISGPAGIFSWTFTDPDPGDSQSAYQVQVDKNSNFNSPEDDSGKVTSSSNSYATILGKLKYKTTYYWRVKVWDNHDAGSVWADGPSFTTPEHAYPSIDFSWAPQIPGVNEDVLFTDKSTVFGGASKTSWSWTFQNGSPATSNEQDPTVNFFSIGEKLITLRVTDSDGFSCSRSKTLNAEFPLPKWKEIAPF